MRPEFYDTWKVFPPAYLGADERALLAKLFRSVFEVQRALSVLREGNLWFPEFDHPFLELDLLEARAFRLTRKLYRLIRELEEIGLEEPYY